MAATHLAGDQIVIGQYAIQRCLLCGEVLLEFNARNLASPDGNVWSKLSLGGLYEVDGNRTSLIRQTEGTLFESDLDIPENCCIRSLWNKK